MSQPSSPSDSNSTTNDVVPQAPAAPTREIASAMTPEAATAVPMGIETGALLEGKYRVGAIIGAGAFGLVFEAQNLELGETVAIKCLRPELLGNSAVAA